METLKQWLENIKETAKAGAGMFDFAKAIDRIFKIGLILFLLATTLTSCSYAVFFCGC